jgi:hypothetical protein
MRPVDFGPHFALTNGERSDAGDHLPLWEPVSLMHHLPVLGVVFFFTVP